MLRFAIGLPLLLLPGCFRRAYADDISELLVERVRERRSRHGWLSAAGLLFRNVVDLLVVAVAERRDSSFNPPPTVSSRTPATGLRRAAAGSTEGRGARSSPLAAAPSARRAPSAGTAGDPPLAPPRGDSFVWNLVQDLKYAFRSFARQPAFIAVVAITLALGIGANTAVFSVVNGVLLQPLPYAQPDDLIDVWGRFDPISGFDYPTFPLSPPEWVDYRAQSRAMEDVAAFTSSAATLSSGDGDAERITTAPVSHNLFSVLREQPLLGRTFNAEEDYADARVVVLEHGFWRSRFGGDEALLGQAITIDGEPWIVLGVMPPGFSFVRDAKLWLPLGIDPENAGNRQSHFIRSLGRLAPDATLQQAEAEMATLMDAWQAEYPEIHTGHYLYLSPLIEDIVGNVRPALLLLLAAAGLVLLIVCANVASVLLARGEDRTRELAIRGALGAGRGQIMRLLLAENALLSLTGGLLGVGIAWAGVRLLVGAADSALPRVETVAVDGGVLAFAALVTAVTALLFGLAPALHGAGGELQRFLKDGAANVSPSRSRLWFRRGLVVVEVALAFVLAVSAGLVLRSFQSVLSVDPGFATDNLVVAGLSLPRARYQDGAAVQAFYAELLERVEGLPDVVSASASSSLPLRSTPGVWDFRVEGKPIPGDGEPAWNAAFSTVRPGYFETMQARLLRGRLFAPTDTADSQLVTVVNRSMVDKFFAGEDPIGQRIMVCCPDENQQEPWMTIVGVIDDMHYQGLDVEARPAYHAVHAQVERASFGSVFPSMTVVVRAGSDPGAVSGALRGLVVQLDAEVPLVGLQTMDEVLADSVARPRFASRLLGMFALLALALGATGIYGVLAYMVAKRGREIGIRKALGAANGKLAAMVVVQGMGLVGGGLALGAMVSIWSARLLDGMLFGVTAGDAPTYVLVTVILAGVAFVACGVPTLRAVRVDPLVTMRAE